MISFTNSTIPDWLSFVFVAIVVSLWGSSGVPLKYKKLIDLKVEPIIIQFYISMTVFFTSWLVLIYTPFSFNYWYFLNFNNLKGVY
jgi:hypothetical protein